MILRISLAVLGLALYTLPAAAHDNTDIVLDHGAVWETPKKGASSEGFLQIHNTSKSDDLLTGANCPIGFATNLVDAQGKKLASLAIPAGQTVTLSADGPHIEIIGMIYRLEFGGILPCALTFQDNGDVGAYLNAISPPGQK